MHGKLMHNTDVLPAPRRTAIDGEDDSAVLRAVHAFLLDEDAVPALGSDDDTFFSVPLPSYSSTASDSSGSATPPPTAQEPDKAPTKETAARPRVINRSRVRMLNEISTLRQKVIALERRLTEIRECGDDDAASTQKKMDTETVLSAAWQAVAVNQRELVVAAEKDREKLRTRVNNYKLVVRRVRRLLTKHQDETSAMARLRAPDIPHSAVRLLDTRSRFGDLSNHLQEMYWKLDSVFQDRPDAQLDSVTDLLRNVRVHNDDTPNISLEFIESRMLPFDVETTAKAVWYYQSRKAAAFVHDAKDEAVDTDDVIRRSFVSTFSRSQGRMEARRFVDKDRVIFLHCYVFHRMNRDESESIGGIRKFNWTVISPPRNERVRNLAMPACQVDVVEIVVPFFTEGTVVTTQANDEHKAFTIKSVNFVHDFERQAIENILLDGATSTRR